MKKYCNYYFKFFSNPYANNAVNGKKNDIVIQVFFKLNNFSKINKYFSLKINKDFSNNNNSCIFERFYIRIT